jgi:hypothetical protein
MKAMGIKQIILIGFFAVFTPFYVLANKGVVKGKVTDSKNQPVEYATAVLINSKTSEIEKGVMCNDEGSFTIENVAFGEYFLSVRMLGYDSNESEIVVIDNGNQIVDRTIILNETTHELNEVVVTGKYVFVEQTVDKIIVNPNASITSSSESVYDILKKSPGVNIDNNDNITLKGMQGVIIMIDDKPTHLSARI